MAELNYDVFLSYSSVDRSSARHLATRLALDGLRIWFDEWEIRPGDNIPLKVSQGVEQARVLVLFMTPAFFASEWTSFESYSAVFRDPMNRERRFIPLLAADCQRPLTLAQFRHIDYRARRPEDYEELLVACRQRMQPDVVTAASSRVRIAATQSLGVPHDETTLNKRLSEDVTLRFTYSSAPPGITLPQGPEEVHTTWLEVFRVVGGSLLGECPEYELNTRLRVSFVALPRGVSVFFVHLNEDDFEQVKLTLAAIGLVEPSASQQPTRSDCRHLRLSSLGRDILFTYY